MAAVPKQTSQEIHIRDLLNFAVIPLHPHTSNPLFKLVPQDLILLTSTLQATSSRDGRTGRRRPSRGHHSNRDNSDGDSDDLGLVRVGQRVGRGLDGVADGARLVGSCGGVLSHQPEPCHAEGKKTYTLEIRVCLVGDLLDTAHELAGPSGLLGGGRLLVNLGRDGACLALGLSAESSVLSQYPG